MAIIVSCSHQIHPFVVLNAFQHGLMYFDEAISGHINQELGLSEDLVAKIRHSAVTVCCRQLFHINGQTHLFKLTVSHCVSTVTFLTPSLTIKKKKKSLMN